jgi:hypothetical protein
MASPEFSVATMKYRTNVESPSEADVLRNLEREILDAVASEECPSGWYRPHSPYLCPVFQRPSHDTNIQFTNLGLATTLRPTTGSSK